jgi:hypothetical protein
MGIDASDQCLGFAEDAVVQIFAGNIYHDLYFRLHYNPTIRLASVSFKLMLPTSRNWQNCGTITNFLPIDESLSFIGKLLTSNLSDSYEGMLSLGSHGWLSFHNSSSREGILTGKFLYIY